MNDKSKKTSEFMDKQMMDLSSSSPVEEIVPSYDFHPIRPTTTVYLAGSTASRVCSASDSTLSSNKGFGSLDSTEPTQLVPDKGHNPLGSTILSEIDTTMKRHADTLLHVMDGVTARLTLLETRTHNLENLLNDLKVSVDKCHHGNMTQIQNILVEVQSGVQLLKDKHEIFEAQLQVSKEDQHPKTHSLHVDPTAQSPAPVTPQQMPQSPLTSFPQAPSSAAALSHPPSSHQHEPYFPPPSHSQPPPPNQLPYQSRYPQQPPPPSGYIPEEHPSYAAQSYTPNPPRQQPPAGSAPSQQFYNAPQPQPSMYDGAAGGRSNSSFPSGYSPESYPYTGSPMASAKPPPHVSGSGANYQQLSNSRPLPVAAAVSSASSSPRSESRVPIDDVIDRVTTMGFPRDQVRATVRKLTENGQAVDLNVVLDKLMNEGGGAWFGGR